MISLEVCSWGEEELYIFPTTLHGSTRKINPTQQTNSTVYLPERAVVYCTEYDPDKGTLLLIQTPKGLIEKDDLRSWSRYNTSTRLITPDRAFFGRFATIEPDGTYDPPQLPMILRHVQEKWGWRVFPGLLDMLGNPRPAVASPARA